MKLPIINLEETPGKMVGRPRAVDYGRLVANARSMMPCLPFPKGVFRFRTHEEADAWMNKYILQAAKTKYRVRQARTT